MGMAKGLGSAAVTAVKESRVESREFDPLDTDDFSIAGRQNKSTAERSKVKGSTPRSRLSTLDFLTTERLTQ
jgi:hypothetical protein